MKQLFLSLCLLVAASMFAQAEDQNFYLNDDKISWQKAYATEKSKEEVYQYFENSDIFQKVKQEGNLIIGRLNYYSVDVKKVGIVGVPQIVQKTDFTANVSISYRPEEKDYVVSLSDLVFVGRGDFLKKKEEKPLEEQFVRTGYNEYRPGFLKRPKEVYNTTISPIFEMP
ncbi:MAG: hypothetical protein KDD41_13590 [Flavobacteriales bacterium]|nr:hypothetical protein [Flavobacteriales bacterium]